MACFALTSGNLRGPEMAQAFVAALLRIKRVLRRFAPPFVATVGPAGTVTVIMGAKGTLARPKVIK